MSTERLDLERLDLTAADQQRVDGAFLDAALMVIQVKDHDALPKETVDELERVHNRTLERANDSLIAGRSIDTVTVQNLGKIGFLDTLGIATHDALTRGAPEATKAGIGTWSTRRLFRGHQYIKKPKRGQK